MPDPNRLLVLTELREQAGLTLADMAQRCGLKGRQSRKTVAAWEQGGAIPRARWRVNVATYLRHDLGLAQAPERFAEVWTILVEEWEWDPLTPEELCVGSNGTQLDAPSQQVADPHEVAPIVPTSVETEAESANPNLHSAQRFLNRRQLFQIIGLLSILSFAALTSYIFQQASVRPPNADRAVHVPENLGFEMDVIAPWVARSEGACDLEIRHHGENLPDGERFLQMHKRTAECASVHQARTINPSAETRTFAVWLRSPDGQPRTGAVVIWQGTDALEEHEVKDEEKSAAEFNIVGEQWRCIEASIVIDNPTYTVMHGAIYLDGAEGADLWLDNASFHDGQTSVCPPPGIELRDPGFEFDEQLGGWHWLPQREGCEFVIIENTYDAPEGNHFLSITERAPKCNSLYQDIESPVAQDQKIRAAVWIRSGNKMTVKGRFTLWALDSIEERRATQPFLIDNSWTCIETEYVIELPNAQKLRLEIYLDGDADAVYHFDQLMISAAEAPLCPESAAEILRSGFDTPAELALWERQGFCEFAVVNAPDSALAGAGYLKLSRERIDCHSFYRHALAVPKAGETYTALMWLRSPSTAPRKGRLFVRASGNGEENAELLFTVESQAWTCLETSLTLKQANHLSLGVEVYLDSVDGVDYEFDEISLHRGTERRCPQSYLDIRSSRILIEPAQSYAGSSVAVQAEVRNTNQSDPVENAQLAFWVSDQHNGSHIGPIVRRPIPPLEPGAASLPISADVQLDLGLNPQQDYYIVFDLYADNPALDRDRTLRRDSRPLDILRCEPDMLFCDIPAPHWARAEIESWYENGITKGCNSSGVPFENLTFCPELLVERWMFSVFLLRHKYGADYRPQGPYAQHFADATEDLPFVIWVEDAAKDGLVLDSAHCAPHDAQRYFCPLAPLRRIDLLRSLSQVEQFDLAPFAGRHFSDLPAGSPEAKMADYLWQKGYLFLQDAFCVQTLGTSTICPHEPLRRAEAAHIMARAFGLVDRE